MRIFTIGHSSRSFAEFLDLLKGRGIETLVDIRSVPGSRKFPHFSSESLKKLLPAEGIRYVWIKGLGGLRHPRKDFPSPNVGLTNPGFRAYADYMLSEEFREGVKMLLAIAADSATAYMCAEAVYWRCHRRLLSDYLVANGVEVLHILGKSSPVAHRMTDGATINDDGSVIYTSPNQPEDDD